MVLLMLWLCLTSTSVQAAEDSVGGQVTTDGQITFYEGTESSTNGPDTGNTKESTPGNVSKELANVKERLPSTGERVSESFWLGIVVLIGVGSLVVFNQRKGRGDE